MSARRDISKLFDQWLSLTRAEGHAIRAADWPRARQIQAEKQSLQKEITAAHESLRREKDADLEETPFRRHLPKLLSLENKNARLLEEHVRRSNEERAALEQAQKNLQRIRRSYLRSQARPEWQRLS